jgi:hypothetical protein
MATLIDQSRFRMSDVSYMLKSKTMVAPDDGYYGLIRVPRYAFVTDVWLDVSVAYVGGAPSLSIGWLGNEQTAQENGFIPADLTQPGVLGLKSSVSAAMNAARAKYFASKGGMITATIAAGGATTEGTFTVFCQYCLIQ